MENLKKLGIFFICVIGFVGIICGIGYMAMCKAPFFNILGLLIAAAPDVLLVIHLFKKDVAAKPTTAKK